MRRREPVQPFILRLPKSLHKLLTEAAFQDRRSANDEMIVALEQWIGLRGTRQGRKTKRG
jgi:predicted HicB family RNase H-like nuclease